MTEASDADRAAYWASVAAELGADGPQGYNAAAIAVDRQTALDRGREALRIVGAAKAWRQRGGEPPRRQGRQGNGIINGLTGHGIVISLLR